MTTVLAWFRNDLRVHDNPSLTAAMQTGHSVIACYIATPDQWRLHHMAPIKAAFIHQNLQALQKKLEVLRIPLLFADVGDFEDCGRKLKAWIKQYDANGLFFNREYAFNECQRDERISRDLAALCSIRSFEDQCMVNPGELLTGEGRPYRVFTPFSRAWHTHPSIQNCQVLPTPPPQADTGIASDSLTADAFCLPGHLPERMGRDPGEDAAIKQLKQFAQKSIGAYRQQRDFPDLDATSGLSPYLALGVLSPRLCYQTALKAKREARDADGTACWINELIWREFYIHLIHHYPRLCQYRAFKPETEALRWRDDEEGFRAWCEGRTGIPIVDAAMRQLRDRGWMHNRLRMICAMFLSKNLLIDWRRGERFFMENLIDGHLAANNGGWQWAASTGTDAAPYFRIFNPVTQSQKFDPEGHFIRRYIPELRSLEGKKIHSPHSPALDSAIDYPLPIVDLKSSRQRAIDAFKALS